MLEVVGVTGVVHLGQIQSGLRSAMRIAQVKKRRMTHDSIWLVFAFVEQKFTKCFLLLQGGHIKIHSHSDIPVQVDGEPWIQPPGDVVVFNSALKVSVHHIVCIYTLFIEIYRILYSENVLFICE